MSGRLLQRLKSLRPVSTQHMIKELRVDLISTQHMIKELRDDLSFKLTGMSEDISHLRADVKNVKTDIAQVKQTVGRLESKFGSMLECQVRVEVGRMFGDSYSKQYTARSIINIVSLLPDAAKPCASVVDPHFKLLEAARHVVKRLIEERVPEQVLTMILQFMKSNGYDGSQDLYSQVGAINNAELGKACAWLKDRCKKAKQEEFLESIWGRVYCALGRLKVYFDTPSLDSLTTCEGVGLMCVAAAANGFVTPDGAPILVSEVDFDVKGKLSVHFCDTFRNNPLHVMIETGEIKTHRDYSSAVKQLGFRLQIMKWMVQTMFPKDTKMMVLCIGHLFLCKALVGDVNVDEAQKRIAAADGYSLFVHSL